MIKNDKTPNDNQKLDCKIHVMPPIISDEDISALLNGVVNIMRKKFELENQNEIISLGVNISNLKKELKEKTAECNRLKNEILYLKNQLNQQ